MMDEDHLVKLLEDALAPDTERVKHATTELQKDAFTSAAALISLIHIHVTHTSTDVRQLAAVEARSLVARQWREVSSESRVQARNALLQSIMHLENALLRHTSARLISAIAKIDIDDGEWADLPSFLQQAATSQVPMQREIGVYIFYVLLETAASDFVDQFSVLFDLFKKTIQDPESAEVRINTTLALSRMAMVLDADEDPDSLSAFQEILPRMVTVLQGVVQQRNDEQISQAFEAFQTLLGCDSQLIANHFRDLVVFMLEVAATKNVISEARTQAFSFLISCVKYRKLKIQGLRLGEQLTLRAMESVHEVEELSDGDDDATPGNSALVLLETLAQNLPPSQVVAPLLKALPGYCNSFDPTLRRAAVLALASTVEGAPDFFATQMKEIFPRIIRLLDDQEIRVRQATLYSLARLADDLSEDLAKRHEELIPALTSAFDSAIIEANQGIEPDRQEEIIKATCGAIDAIYVGMEDVDGAKYVQELLPRLSRLLDHPEPTVKAAAISAIGSIAASSGDAFKPYFDPIINALSTYVSIKDGEEDFILRAVVCEALGSIASAVGPEMFRPYVQPLMQASEEALHLDHPRLKETSFVLWGRLARIYKEDFALFLEGVAKSLLDCIQQEETEFEVNLSEEVQDLVGREITIAGKKIKVSSSGRDQGNATLSVERKAANGDGDGDDDDDDVIDISGIDSDDEAWDDLTGASAIAMEKEVALDMLADVLSFTRTKYLPYVEKTVQLVLELVSHSYEGVRRSAIGVLWRAFATLWGICEEGTMAKWQPGLPLKVLPTPELTKLAQAAMAATLTVWKEEPERDVVTEVNRNLAAVLKDCGPAIIDSEETVKTINKILLQILKRHHPCQKDLGLDGEAETLEESSEYDWLVIDTAFDVIAGMAAALGPTFAQLEKVFEKPILKYFGSSDAVERAASVGALASCIGSMGAAVTPFTSNLLKQFIHRLGDEDGDTRSNAAWAIGLLCEHSDAIPDLQSSYPTILTKLEPMFFHDQATVKDNAAGCVSRLILRFPDKVPLDHVLPVLIDSLPLRQDYGENEVVWDMIVKLYQSQNESMKNATVDLMPSLSLVLGEPRLQLSEARRQDVIQLVKYLHEQQPSLLGIDEVLHRVLTE